MSVPPFIPPHPSEMSSESPSRNAPRVIPPDTSLCASPPGSAGYPQPGWPGFGHPQQRGRMGFVGGPPFDHGTFFGYPAGGIATPGMVHPGLDPRWYVPGGGYLLTPEGYIPTPLGHPAPVIPPRPSSSRSRERPRSRGEGRRELPPDWIGPQTRKEAASASARYTPLPPGVGYGMDGLPTDFSTFNTELPHAGYYPYGYVPGYPYGCGPRVYPRRNPSAQPTPYMGGGYLPETPGEVHEQLDERDRHPPVARPERGLGKIDTRWFAGSSYGPVLDPLLASVVKCKVKVNPLLQPPPGNPAIRPYLAWNMLYSSSFVHRSDERENQPWMKGRDAPATYPRLSSLRLRVISRQFTWFIEVKAKNKNVGVTCGDLVDTLSEFLHQMTAKKDYESLSQEDQNKMAESYHYNREAHDDVPGGRLGQGMKRCDFLLDKTMWGGMEVNQEFVKEKMTLLGVSNERNDTGNRRRQQREVVDVFDVICEGRLPMMQVGAEDA